MNDRQRATGRVWLITGASSGFGRALAEAALAAGDTVVAAARRTAPLEDLVARHPDRAVARSRWTSPTSTSPRPRSRTQCSGTGGSTCSSTTPDAA